MNEKQAELESKIDKTYQALEIKFTNSQLGTEGSVEKKKNMVGNLTEQFNLINQQFVDIQEDIQGRDYGVNDFG